MISYQLFSEADFAALLTEAAIFLAVLYVCIFAVLALVETRQDRILQEIEEAKANNTKARGYIYKGNK